MKSIRKVALMGLIMMMALLAACGGAGGAPEPAADVATAVVATEAVATVVEATEVVAQATAAPTDAPTTAPTAEPTSTPEPTVAPTEAPLPVISLETLIGLFNQYDYDAGGDNWLMFNEDGTFAGRHGPAFDTGVHVTEGTYTLDGDVLTLIDPEQCPTGESYRLEYRNQTQVHFTVEGEVACDYLAADFERQPNWKRVEP